MKMKKIVFYSIALFAISLASCKKDYTCTCTDTSPTGPSSTSTTLYKSVTSKSANANCVSEDVKDVNGNLIFSKSCSLK